MIGIGMAGPIGASIAGEVGAGSIGQGGPDVFGGWNTILDARTGEHRSGGSRVNSANQINAILSATLPQPFGLINAGMSLFGKGLGNVAQGDPNIGTGVNGPDLGVGVGGGPPAAPPTQPTKTIKTIQKVLEAPPAAPPAVEPDLKRKRIGRQQTILTSSALADTPTYKPTLLGM